MWVVPVTQPAHCSIFCCCFIFIFFIINEETWQGQAIGLPQVTQLRGTTGAKPGVHLLSAQISTMLDYFSKGKNLDILEGTVPLLKRHLLTS